MRSMSPTTSVHFLLQTVQTKKVKAKMFALATLLALAAPAMAQFALTVSADDCRQSPTREKKTEKNHKKIFFSIFFPFFSFRPFACVARCVLRTCL
jgi:hypothetical protein